MKYEIWYFISAITVLVLNGFFYGCILHVESTVVQEDPKEDYIQLRIRADEQFRTKASTDLSCRNLDIIVEAESFDKLVATGCNRTAVYIFDTHRMDYVLQRISDIPEEMTPQNDSVPQFNEECPCLSDK